MDHLSNSDRDVDAGNGVRLHLGWVYSHLADIGGRSCGDAVDQWPPSRMKRGYKSKGDGIVQAKLNLLIFPQVPNTPLNLYLHA